MAQTWKEELRDKLIQAYGMKKGTTLYKKYNATFSAGYTDEFSPEVAARDLHFLEQISPENPLVCQFYLATAQFEHQLHLRLYQWGTPIALSDILPILENFDLRTYNERPYRLILNEKQKVYISDFAVEYIKGELKIDEIQDLFQEAFTHIYFELAENDGLNKLILGAKLTWREVMILRTYAKYLHQIRFRFSQTYIEKALVENPHITKNLVDLFLIMHNPSKTTKSKTLASKYEQSILEQLDSVASLDEDRIIRRILELIKASLRTNYYQLNENHTNKSYLSLKLSSRIIPEMPLPMPLYEIFVYATRFEAIHLRHAKIARGGIRWSDRREDFRTEILGLMKAQVVKNSIIVPSGAKGGFVLKNPKAQKTRETLHAEVVECYKLFISGLLDLTDNIVDGKTVRPQDVVCYDDADTYLVVAADKGTATFSDIANSISMEYHFWLGDAFASGGSTGYDHKKMGITARGCWESIKRHFRELNVDPLKTSISVIGVGDMSGDVFGNGLIYTNTLKLIAAFDHRNIFVDPNPDPETSYNERLRLFNLPSSSWEDYNAKLISKGGGVFKRSAKSILITPQMKQALGISDAALAPNDLIRAILCAPVDLFYNGGIGTYVKSRGQTQLEVGDRTNDYCRVNGDELRCKVVGEGGNLGFTQLGRVEFALKGGLINTDFIDNSGGVDCSDHEVNLKILLDTEVHRKKMTMKQRNTLLASLTDEVASLVLKDNYYQALVMSFSAFHSEKNISLHTDYIRELESLGILNRKVEFLPDDKQLLERKADGIGLTRPELAVLLAYTKIYIKQELCKSKIVNDEYLKHVVVKAFPNSLRKKYYQAMLEHRLHADIIANVLSNRIVNEMGITFVYRLQMETGATIPEIVRAQTVAAEVFGTRELRDLIETLDYRIDMSEQYEMFYNIRQLSNLATRWFLRSTYMQEDLETVINHFAPRVKALTSLTPKLMAGVTREYLDKLMERFTKTGLPKETAQRVATYRAIYTSLNIIDVATKNNLDLEKTARIYFTAGERIHLLWFRDQLASDSREGHWNVLARLTLRDELDIAQRALTIAIMRNDKKEDDLGKLLDIWICKNKSALDRWERLLELLHRSTNIDYSMFFIAIRELLSLIGISQPTLRGG